MPQSPILFPLTYRFKSGVGETPFMPAALPRVTQGMPAAAAAPPSTGPYLYDRVKETSVTTGTGTLFLDGTGGLNFDRFVDLVGSGNSCYYEIVNRSTNERETGMGVVTSGTGGFGDTLSRATVLRSSNGNALVNFSAGTKDVFITIPAAIISPTNNVYNVKGFGAKGDVQIVTDGNTDPASAVVTCATSAPFVPADVGKQIVIFAGSGFGPAAGSTVLVSSIATYISPTQITMALAATGNISGSTVIWGTDDTAAIQAAINATKTNGGEVRFPPGRYGITSTLTLRSTTRLADFQSTALIGAGTSHTQHPTSSELLYYPATMLAWMSSTKAPFIQTGDPPFVQAGAYSVNGLRIENIFFLGNYLATNALVLDRCNWSTFRNLTIFSLEQTGKMPSAVSSATVADPVDTPTINTTGGGTTGGGMAAGNYRLKYALQDLNGETLPSPESADFNIPALTAPVAGPTMVANGSGSSLAAGTYLCAYTYVNDSGETIPGPDTSVTITTAGQNLVFTLPANPTGVTGKNCYTSDVNGLTTTKKMMNLALVTGTTFTQTQDFPSGQPYPAATLAGDGRIPRVTTTAAPSSSGRRFYLTPPNGNPNGEMRFPVKGVDATNVDLIAVNTIGNGVGVLPNVGGGLHNHALLLHAVNDGRANTDGAWNLFEMIQCYDSPGICRIVGDKSAGSNYCHCTFIRCDCRFNGFAAWMLESTDNNSFMGTYADRADGQGVGIYNYPLSRQSTWVNAEIDGSTFTDHPTVASASNSAYGYDRGNAQAASIQFQAGTTAPTLALAAGGSLPNGTQQFYRIEALLANGIRVTQSLEANITPSGANLTVQLSGYTISGATGYKIWRGTATNAENTYYFTTSSTFNDTGSAGNTGYVIETGLLNGAFLFQETGIVARRFNMGSTELILGASSTSIPSMNMPVGIAPTSPSAGDIWADASQKCIVEYISGVKQQRESVLGVTTTAVSSTTTAETKSLIGTIVGSFTCPANFMVAGKRLRFNGYGNITTGGTASTIDFQVFFGATKIASTGALAPTISQSNRQWRFDIEIVCVTTGGSGTLFCQGVVDVMNAAAPIAATRWPLLGNNATPPAAVTVDTTASSLIDFKTVTGNNLHTITLNPGTSLEVMN